MLILLILHSSNKLKYIINHGNKKSTFLSFSSICPWIHETWVSILVQTLGRNFRPQPLLQLTTPMTSNLTLSFGAGISRTIGDPLSPWNNFVQVSEKWLWEKKNNENWTILDKSLDHHSKILQSQKVAWVHIPVSQRQLENCSKTSTLPNRLKLLQWKFLAIVETNLQSHISHRCNHILWQILPDQCNQWQSHFQLEEASKPEIKWVMGQFLL